MSAMTPTRVDKIPVLRLPEAHRAAATEYQRYLDQIRKLRPNDWDKATDCTRWTVHDLVAHTVGQTQGFASLRENARQFRLGAKVQREISAPYPVDGTNEVQVRDRRDWTPQQLIDAYAAAVAGHPCPLRAAADPDQAARLHHAPGDHTGRLDAPHRPVAGHRGTVRAHPGARRPNRGRPCPGMVHDAQRPIRPAADRAGGRALRLRCRRAAGNGRGGVLADPFRPRQWRRSAGAPIPAVIRCPPLRCASSGPCWRLVLTDPAVLRHSTAGDSINLLARWYRVHRRSRQAVAPGVAGEWDI